MRRTAILCALLLWPGISGCEEDAFIGSFPVMVVGAESIEFGAVPVGRTSIREVEIQNSGANDLILQEPAVWENPGGAFSAGEYDQVIPPGTSGVMQVVFAPPDIERYESILVIKGNDPENQSVQVDLGGDGFRQGAIEVVPLHVDFGSVNAGSVALDTVYVRNVGNGVLYVNRVDLTESTKTSFPDYQVLNPFEATGPKEGLLEEGETLRMKLHDKHLSPIAYTGSHALHDLLHQICIFHTKPFNQDVVIRHRDREFYHAVPEVRQHRVQFAV